MCTVTWLIEAGAYEVFFNRDELRSRGPGLPPRLEQEDGVRYLAPADSDAGGTWIFVNELGVAGCLLNLYAEGAAAAGDRYESRGRLVRRLAASAAAKDVEQRLSGAELERLRSFTFLLFGPDEAPRAWRWDGRRLERPVLSEPPISSSSFDTERVIASRRRVWRRMLDTRKADHALHLAYHRCALPEPGPYAPAMSRPDARTVSLTWLRAEPGRVRMRYADGPPARTELGAERLLDRRRSEVFGV